jgi:hypothetical protein
MISFAPKGVSFVPKGIPYAPNELLSHPAFSHISVAQ